MCLCQDEGYFVKKADQNKNTTSDKPPAQFVPAPTDKNEQPIRNQPSRAKERD